MIGVIIALMSVAQKLHIHFDPDHLTPLIQFKDVWHEGRFHSFEPDDLSALLILQKNTEKKVSYVRAFRGWKTSGLQIERRSDGRAFNAWLNKYKLSVLWESGDFIVNPLLSSQKAPRHDPTDELAEGHSFVIRPTMVDGRHIKLYVQDPDMIKLLNLHLGRKVSFSELTRSYIENRLKWQKGNILAPTFLDWIIATGVRPHVEEGELGFFPQICLGQT